MKTKYITTELHPELKEGIIFEQSQNRNSYCVHPATDKSSLYMEQHTKKGLEKGYIKEVQEPKWTDQDMIDFVNITNHKCGYMDSLKAALEQFEIDKNKNESN